MPVGLLRDKILYGILHKRRGVHPYALIRWVIGIGSTVAIALLPLLDILRFDLWDGRHHVLGEPSTFIETLRAFAFPFLALNIAIVLVTRLVGRYLCGFVCPVGSLARFAEWARFTTRKGTRQYLAPLFVLSSCTVLAAITFNFWVDWHVFVEGSPLAIGISATFFASMALGLFGICQWLGLRFCREWCPSGVYFAVLGHRSVNGIEFAHPETCTDCGACAKVCPVDLEPRSMAGGAYRPGLGLYGDGMSNFANCLRCGDCVIACEGANARVDEALPLRMGFLDEPAREHRNDVRATPPPGRAPARRRAKNVPTDVAAASAEKNEP